MTSAFLTTTSSIPSPSYRRSITAPTAANLPPLLTHAANIMPSKNPRNNNNNHGDGIPFHGTPRTKRPASTNSSSRQHQRWLFGGATAISTPVAPKLSSCFSMWNLNKHRIVTGILAVLLLSTIGFVSLYKFHKGFHRIVTFWSSVAPMVADYKWTKVRAGTKAWNQTQSKLFHQRTAPKAVALVQRMGGIYTKMGQVISTLGAGFIDDTYVQAMRPLQDGVEPRALSEIAAIFEQSTGQRLDEVFDEFDPTPIGAASIAQAHRAVLKGDSSSSSYNDRVVLVKIQYPEVAELFDADLTNMEILFQWFIPGSEDMVRGIRQRHERELDFRLEADHLRECTANLQRYDQMEPKLVRIPRVRNETGLCTQQVLVMEFLQGMPLSKAIAQEQDRMARALGKANGEELRQVLLERIKEHLHQDGNEVHHDHNEELTIIEENNQQNPLDFWADRRAGGTEKQNSGSSNKVGQWLQQIATGPVGAQLFRTFVGLRDGWSHFSDHVAHALHDATVRRHRLDDDELMARPKPQPRINLGKVMKTLVRVHGIQMLLDGVYNSDPHPGNVLVLPDGRLGLLDYGMVGRLSDEQRRNMTKTILALHHRDTDAVHAIYRDSGYQATWKEGDCLQDPNLIHRFATFHFDRFDMSPITLSSNNNSTKSSGETHRRTLATMDLLRSVQEWSVPDWVEQGRRLTGLLLGVSLQAARPMSLAKEWHDIAEQAMKKFEEEDATKES